MGALGPWLVVPVPMGPHVAPMGPHVAPMGFPWGTHGGAHGGTYDGPYYPFVGYRSLWTLSGACPVY